MSGKNSWYVRSNQRISGPFPAKLISRRVLLGRFQLTDEVSADKENWVQIRQLPDLVPDLLRQDQSDPFVKERVAAARRWEDERGSRDRRDNESADINRQFADQRKPGERRQLEEFAEVNYRENRDEREFDKDFRRRPVERIQPKTYTVQGVMLLLVVLAGIYMAYMYMPRTVLESVNSCDAPPAAKVNWSNCNLQGIKVSMKEMQGAVLKNANLTGAYMSGLDMKTADISYAIFSMADLSRSDLSNTQALGVNFRNADLTEANFQSSNLAYANFTDANLLQTNFEGALLDKAIWVDGRVCAVGSVGTCD